MAAAIVWVALPFDQLSLLELIEHADELAAVEVENVGECRLGSARPLTEGHEHAVLVDAEARLFELLDEARLERKTQARQEKERAPQELLWELRLTRLSLCGTHFKEE